MLRISRKHSTFEQSDKQDNMANLFEARVRYEKTLDNGVMKIVTEPYIVAAMSCTEAEARIVEELSPYITSNLNVQSVKGVKISEVFTTTEDKEKWYRVKVNFITLDEKSGTEKSMASHMLVNEDNLEDALSLFIERMKGTLSEYEIASITETPIVDVYVGK